MGQSASQAHAFYRDVAQTGTVWTIRDEGGFPVPLKEDGKRAQPFWSTLGRVKKIIKNVPTYNAFEPVELSWEQFRSQWLPGLEKDGHLVGVNWSGQYATGYDLEPQFVKNAIESQIERIEKTASQPPEKTTPKWLRFFRR